MTTKTDYDALFDTIDAETTRIGTEFADILAELAGGGLTPAQEAELLARGNAAVDRLKGIKKTNPTGDPVPVEPAPGGEGEAPGPVDTQG